MVGQVNIYCDCPLWPDDAMCSLEACSVCECDSSEVPAPWKAEEDRYPMGCNTGEVHGSLTLINLPADLWEECLL